MKKTGIILLFAGLLMTLYAGIACFVREKILDSGKLEIKKDIQNAVNWQLYVGVGLMFIGGVVLVLRVNREDEKEINDNLH